MAGQQGARPQGPRKAASADVARANGHRPGEVVTGKVQMPSDPAALERAIEDRRQQLAVTIDELMYRTKPKVLAARGAASAQAKAKGLVTTADGAPDPVKISAFALGVATFVALIVWRRRKS